MLGFYICDLIATGGPAAPEFVRIVWNRITSAELLLKIPTLYNNNGWRNMLGFRE